MQPYARSKNLYQRTDIASADPLRLVVLLYEGILKHISGAIQNLKTKEIEARCNHINRALAMISELQATLNREKGGEVAKNLDTLYNYWRKRLLEASFEKSLEPLEEVQRLVSELWSAWNEAANRNTPKNNLNEPIPPTLKSGSNVFRA
jgi:flagellar secretion chaperone FliS